MSWTTSLVMHCDGEGCDKNAQFPNIGRKAVEAAMGKIGWLIVRNKHTMKRHYCRDCRGQYEM